MDELGLGEVWKKQKAKRAAAAEAGEDGEAAGKDSVWKRASEKAKESAKKVKDRASKASESKAAEGDGAPEPPPPSESLSGRIKTELGKTARSLVGRSRRSQRTVRSKVSGAPRSEWSSAVDKASGKTYYFNTVTMETTWEKPAGWTPPRPEGEEDAEAEGKEAQEGKEGEEGEAGEEETVSHDGPAEMVYVGEASTAWERVSERLKHTPVFRSILGAASRVADSSAGRAAKTAADTLNDVGGAAREEWETSQNPIIDRLSSAWSRAFGETEHARVIRELRRTQPDFILEELLTDAEELIVPEVIGAYLAGDSRTLRKWCNEGAYATLNASIADRRAANVVLDSPILGVKNFQLFAAKLDDGAPPMLATTFTVHQIHCVRSRSSGEIVEGADDSVKGVTYAMSLVRDFDEDENEFDWKVAEVGIVMEVDTF
eukprot:PLAT778.2.p1 GENE.PLAT778.2~~PLAT778.2.p1  ORF type:complete len:431 (+),score=183.11 PLAT778.2:549-1841(+)